MAETVITGMRALESQADPIPEETIVPFSPNGVLQLGGQTWEILHTPGHASMQTCFYQRDTRQLISADMLLAITPTPVVEQPPAGVDHRVPALPLFMESLDLIEQLEVEEVFPGHGRPFGDHRAVIARQRERILGRKAECLELVQQGIDTLPELTERMYSHQPKGVRLTGLWMLIGYLDLLINDGLIQEETVDGVWHYTPV
ncbi:MAG: MBL fold metallo-hydrolase [Chloroflexota bacterium]